MTKERVVVAMSGGVDSAAAAGLLREAGYDVVGATMKMYEASRPARARSCCGDRDAEDARRSAEILGIPHYVLDYVEAFARGVVDPFVAAYAAGRTPNPCVSCNNVVKLGALRAFADDLGAAYMATGHYARLEHGPDGPRLYRTANPKDQAYALAGLTREQLARLLLPVGTLPKARTREEARRLGLPVAEKPESQDICFVEGGDYRDALARRREAPPAPGEIVTTAGEVVGFHTGVEAYTVGQRARLGGAAAARYVIRIDAAARRVYVGPREALAVDGLLAEGLNALRPERLVGEAAVEAVTRSHAAPVRATVRIEPGDRLRLRFERPQEAVAPGQQLVLLAPEDGEVLAAATIAA